MLFPTSVIILATRRNEERTLMPRKDSEVFDPIHSTPTLRLFS